MAQIKNMAEYMEKQQKRLSDAVVKTLIGTAGKVINGTDTSRNGTPRVTGRARANWQSNMNDPARGTLEVYDYSGEVAKGQAALVARNAVGQVFYLTNNLPYIRKLEYGSSKQAPGGMLRVAIKEIPRDFQRNLKATR